MHYTGIFVVFVTHNMIFTLCWFLQFIK